MPLIGNLAEVDIANVIELARQSGEPGRLIIRGADGEAVIFVEDGEVVHAELGSRKGEEVIHEILAWGSGEFELQLGIPAPERTITTGWSALLLDGLRRIDESAALAGELEMPDILQPQQDEGGGKKMAKKRSEVLAEILDSLLAGSADINGAIIVSHDGLVLASNLPHDADEARLGATAAALLGLSKRSTPTLGRGDFTQSLIQGTDGNIIITSAGDRAVFIGLTPKDVNLGMVFVEARDAAEQIAKAMES